jgi:hypothetical protein
MLRNYNTSIQSLTRKTYERTKQKISSKLKTSVLYYLKPLTLNFFKGGNMAAKKKAAKKAARCVATTKEKKRCKNKASGKSKFCAAHKK